MGKTMPTSPSIQECVCTLSGGKRHASIHFSVAESYSLGSDKETNPGMQTTHVTHVSGHHSTSGHTWQAEDTQESLLSSHQLYTWNWGAFAAHPSTPTNLNKSWLCWPLPQPNPHRWGADGGEPSQGKNITAGRGKSWQVTFKKTGFFKMFSLVLKKKNYKGKSDNQRMHGLWGRKVGNWVRKGKGLTKHHFEKRDVSKSMGPKDMFPEMLIDEYIPFTENRLKTRILFLSWGEL